MNQQMVNNILIWERELEVQKLSREAALFRSEVDQAEGPWPVQESRWSFLVDLFRAGSRRRQQAAQSC